jgi:hypothetical protein
MILLTRLGTVREGAGQIESLTNYLKHLHDILILAAEMGHDVVLRAHSLTDEIWDRKMRYHTGHALGDLLLGVAKKGASVLVLSMGRMPKAIAPSVVDFFNVRGDPRRKLLIMKGDDAPYADDVCLVAGNGTTFNAITATFSEFDELKSSAVMFGGNEAALVAAEMQRRLALLEIPDRPDAVVIA